jgi:uncharacterized protein involved in exopolysaccharide biosynthesis
MATRTDEFSDPRDWGGDGVRQGAPIDQGRLWLSVKHGWRWIPISAAVWGLLGVIVAFVFIKHSYKAEAVLLWQPASPERAAERQLATQAGTIKLPGALRKVKDRLKMGVPIKQIDSQVEVWFDTRSNLVTINAAGPRARDALVLTNTVVQVFLEGQYELARAHADEVARALDKDLSVAQGQLHKTNESFDEFRAANGVTDIEHETQLAIDNAAHLREQLEQARADSDALDARATTLGSETKKQQRMSVQSSSSVNPDAQKLAELRSELASAKARYSPEHPRIAMLEAQIAALQSHVGKGSSVVASTTTAANPEYQALQANLSATRVDREAATKRVKSYEEFLQTADGRVSTLTGLQGKARSFQADIDLLQKRITDLQTQLSEARDAARSPPVEWRVVTPAVEPDLPEQSKRRTVAAVMPVAGVLVALLALLVRPILDGRVYTAREAAYWSRAPVIASSTWPRNRDMFFSLVDELGHHGSSARGYTLVLGASGREKPMAEELAYWLGGNPTSGGRAAAAGSAATAVSASARPVAAATTRIEGNPKPVEERTTTPEVRTVEPVIAEPVERSVALVNLPRQGTALGAYPAEGTHAWLGAPEGPALRRAARMADRVIVLLASGAEAFTSVAGLRVRIGREAGLAIVLLGLDAELLKLPDRIGDVEAFWSSGQRARG